MHKFVIVKLLEYNIKRNYNYLCCMGSIVSK